MGTTIPRAAGPGTASITIGNMIKPIPPIENLEKPVTKPAASKLNSAISKRIPLRKFGKEEVIKN
jgi:hypothetical protein